jgi:hypothetical protein
MGERWGGAGRGRGEDGEDRFGGVFKNEAEFLRAPKWHFNLFTVTSATILHRMRYHLLQDQENIYSQCQILFTSLSASYEIRYCREGI